MGRIAGNLKEAGAGFRRFGIGRGMAYTALLVVLAFAKPALGPMHPDEARFTAPTNPWEAEPLSGREEMSWPEFGRRYRFETFALEMR